MTDNEKKWVGVMLLFTGIGYACGILIKYILVKLLAVGTFETLKALITPACMVIALFIFLYIYQKYKES